MTHAEIIDKFSGLSILPTPQRMEIAQILFAEPQHLSADMIIDRLKAQGSKVSKATVYNTLHLFAGKGLVGRRLLDPERVLYDSVTEPHHHLLNVDTGELEDIPHDSVRIASLPSLPENTEQMSVEVIIKVRRS